MSDNVDKSIKYWIVRQTIFHDNNKKYISCTYGYIDKYKIPNVKRWYFDNKDIAETCAKMLRMVDLNFNYKKAFEDMVNEHAIFIEDDFV